MVFWCVFDPFWSSPNQWQVYCHPVWRTLISSDCQAWQESALEYSCSLYPSVRYVHAFTSPTCPWYRLMPTLQSSTKYLKGLNLMSADLCIRYGCGAADTAHADMIGKMRVYEPTQAGMRHHAPHMIHAWRLEFSPHHLSSCSSTEIFLPRDASDDISSRCSTAAMCQHLHFFAVVWYAHSHVGLSSSNHTPYHLPSVLWEATSGRFTPSVLIWSPFW